MTTEVTFPLAFVAGLLSFLSPCVLPLVPSYASIVTGMSFDELTEAVDRKRVRALTILNSLLFVMGFSVVFIALGAASSVLGRLLIEYRDWLRIAGGTLVIVFGLFVSGFFNFDFLMRQMRFDLNLKKTGPAGTFLMGVTFAACWTPCIGPILGSILLVASSQASTAYGMKLLIVYSAGLAVPFIVSALALNSFISYSRHLFRHMRYIKVAGGIILVIFGVLMLTDNINVLSYYVPDLGINL